MTRRYYVPELPAAGGLITLPDTESHHAIRVMRVKIGEEIELFDGKGSQSQATICELSRNECHCDSLPASIVDREPACNVHLGIALPKPDRARELIERLSELGVQSVTPIVASRTQRPPSESLLEKLRKGIIEACKQSGRNQLLQIEPTLSSTEYFGNASPDATRVISHPSPDAQRISEVGTLNVQAAIGPEGGWTDDEFADAVARGFTPVDLGKRIYRIETAATVIAAVLVSDSC
ncbi:MAG: 16S rRNA (uracil(1498)-N(3))-methyltransferase [Rubripirellula sp.]